MERMKALSRGTKLMLAACVLLVVDLFFTWQKLEVDYGRQGVFVSPQDGLDATGLLIGLLTAGLVALVIIVRATDKELSPDVPWNETIVAIGGLVFLLALLKNLTDDDSAWASYVGVLLAGLTAAGAVMTRAEPRREPTVETTRPARAWETPRPTHPRETARPTHPRETARPTRVRRVSPEYEPMTEPEQTPIEPAARKW